VSDFTTDTVAAKVAFTTYLNASFAAILDQRISIFEFDKQPLQATSIEQPLYSSFAFSCAFDS
jgi:hypothetical protein